jgi:putative ABC transport system substrate-binding protein
VFISQGDPVKFGLVASLGRPGGLATGLSLLAVDLLSKRLEVLRQLTAARIGFLINPKGAEGNAQRAELLEIAGVLGREVVFVEASTPAEIEATFLSLPHIGIGALLVSTDAFFFTQRERLTKLAASSGTPTVYDRREFITGGGLLSYGADYRYAFRQLGIYTGKVLKGARPADLPVEQSSRVELVINLKTANTLGLTIPPTLLARADEVIE